MKKVILASLILVGTTAANAGTIVANGGAQGGMGANGGMGPANGGMGPANGGMGPATVAWDLLTVAWEAVQLQSLNWTHLVRQLHWHWLQVSVVSHLSADAENLRNRVFVISNRKSPASCRVFLAYNLARCRQLALKV